MSFDKTVEFRIFGTTVQVGDIRLPVGDSTANAFTSQVNQLRGTMFWDRCMYILEGVAVAGGATGGSYTVTVETDAILGYTALPIARIAGVGPNSNGTLILDSLHQSSGSPQPTHLFIDQTAAGGGITLQCHAIARQYRGALGTAGANTSERVLSGTIMSEATLTSDITFIIGTTVTSMGMGRMRLWDQAMFWIVSGPNIAGTGEVDIIAQVGGNTVSIAALTTSALANDDEKLALVNAFYGQCPNPTQIIWTEVDNGVMSGSSLVMIAKSGRGSLAKH